MKFIGLHFYILLQLSDSDDNKRKFCPVGKLLPGVYVAIMDENLQPLPVGLSGEVMPNTGGLVN